MLRWAILCVSLVAISAMSIKDLNSAESQEDFAELFGNHSSVESELGTDQTITFEFGKRVESKTNK